MNETGASVWCRLDLPQMNCHKQLVIFQAFVEDETAGEALFLGLMFYGSGSFLSQAEQRLRRPAGSLLSLSKTGRSQN